MKQVLRMRPHLVYNLGVCFGPYNILKSFKLAAERMGHDLWTTNQKAMRVNINKSAQKAVAKVL